MGGGDGGAIMNNKIQKGHKLTATSEVLGAKAGYSAHVVPPRRWADHLSHSPARPTSPPTLTPFKHQGTSFLFLLPPAAAQAPIKPCLNSSCGLLSISID